MVEIRNQTRTTTVVSRARRANSFWLRLKGLMFTPSLPEGEALILSPCNSVHMFFMRYALDVIFTDESWTVVKVIPGLKPWRCTWIYPKAVHCIEANPGVIEASSTRVGDRLCLVEP